MEKKKKGKRCNKTWRRDIIVRNEEKRKSTP